MGLPNTETNNQGNPSQSQPATQQNVQYLINELGITPRFNAMTDEPEFYKGDRRIDQERALATITDLGLIYKIKATSRVEEMALLIARENAYHPMQEWLESLPSGVTGAIDGLAASVETKNPLWPVYLRKWMIQVVDAVMRWDAEPESYPYVLVLSGGQGVGKSQFFDNLGGEFFRGEAELHLGSSSGKDHQLAALKHPMVELAELDGIFRKADVSHMKSFLSRETDEIRAPYARRAVVRRRMTCFCGTVNGAEFLNDSSGSRRFWPVQVDAMDWSVWDRVAWADLWAEAVDAWEAGESWHLTAEEDQVRCDVSLDIHTAEAEEVEILADYWVHHRGHRDLFTPMNRTEILEMLGFRRVSHKVRGEIFDWLERVVGHNRTLEAPTGRPGETYQKKRAWLFPFLEFASDRGTWRAPVKGEVVDFPGNSPSES